VLVLGIGIEELGIVGEHPVEVERPDVEDAVEVDLAVAGAHDRRDRVDLADPPLDLGELVGVDQVDLVEHHPVGERELLDRLVLDALGLVVVEVLQEVLGVDHRDDRVEPQLARDLVVDEERLRHRCRVGEAGGLDHDLVELVAALHQVAEDADQVAAHGAADAAVVHLEDLLLGVEHEGVVDADLAELVLDDGDPLAVLLGEDVVQQRRLAGAEEPGEHGDGDPQNPSRCGPVSATRRARGRPRRSVRSSGRVASRGDS
jgi:hypothetical protein